jgi:SAM-dependent methyltransferase
MGHPLITVDNKVRLCSCPRCNSDKSKLVFRTPDRPFPSQEEFFASRCLDCGLLYQNPRILPEFLPAHYPESYAPYAVMKLPMDEEGLWYLKHYKGYENINIRCRLSRRQKKRSRWNDNTLLVPEFVSGGRLLEVGCAAGNRLASLRDLGWTKCIGIEISEAPAAVARERGFEVITGPIETAICSIPDNSLDVIVSRFVIEHLENPFPVIKQLAGKLRGGGQFLFSTVNIDSPDFWLYGPHWFHLDLPRHMVFFRKRDVEAMLDHDFRIERVRYEPSYYDYERCATYRLMDKGAGWKRVMDILVKLLNGRARRLWVFLAKRGFASRMYVECRKR